MNHSFDIEVAKKCGVNVAILYTNFQFWIAKNKANGKNFRDGRTWTYNSMRALVDLFPYLTLWDVRKALQTLIDKGILLKGNYNQRGGDRTIWYAFEDEKTALRGLPSHLWNPQMVCESKKPICESHTPICESHTALPNPKPNSKPDINKNKELEISPEKVLELDCQIAEQARFLEKQLQQIFKPGKRSAKTFSNIIHFFIALSQQDPLKIGVFKDAVEWARIARLEGRIAGGKALFVETVKQKTGYKKQKLLLQVH